MRVRARGRECSEPSEEAFHIHRAGHAQRTRWTSLRRQQE